MLPLLNPQQSLSIVIELMDSEYDEFLVKAMESQFGRANNAGLSRDDGAYGSGLVGGDDDNNDVGTVDTLISSPEP